MHKVAKFFGIVSALALTLSATPVQAVTESVTVTAEVEGQYTVTIPKEIVLYLQEDGSHMGSYTVDVNGTIPINSYVTVVPESEITLYSEGRQDVECDVTQAVTKFRSTVYNGDLSGIFDTVKIDNSIAEADGSVRTKDGQYLSSGQWHGVLNFEINLVNESPVSTAAQFTETSKGGVVYE